MVETRSKVFRKKNSAHATHVLDFISAVLPAALSAQRKWGIPTNELIVFAAICSDWGRAPLAREHNNYFATRCSQRSHGYRHYASVAESFLHAGRRATTLKPIGQWHDWNSLVESITNGVRGELSCLSAPVSV